MRDAMIDLPIKPEPSKTKPESDVKKYSLKSEKLKYVGTRIYYSRTPNKPVKLDEYYIPVSATSPKLRRLSDDDVYTNTALALCDYVIRRSRNGQPPQKALQKIVTNYWNTILFLRNRGVYSLKDAAKEDIHALCKAFSKEGWTSTLEIERKVSLIIADLNNESMRDAVHVYGQAAESFKTIDALKSFFWRSRIGLKSANLLNKENKNALEKKAKKFGYSFTERWKERFESEPQVPTDNSYRNLLSFLNQLFLLPKSVDKLTFLPYDNPRYWSKKFAERVSDRTANLAVDEASHVLSKALDWIYDYGERLTTILEQCWDKFPKITPKERDKFLISTNPFEQLAEDLGIEIPNVWNMSTHPYTKPEYCQSVDELVGATQGACAIVIAAFNARRSAEVCDDEVGLRELDFLFDSEFDVHKVNFYIEKSYQERHWFYVNKTTADAILLLIRLKRVSRPFDSEHSQDESLFRGHTWTKVGPSKNSSSFTFTRSKEQTRSLISFLAFLDDEYKDLDLKAHMWRRFFSLIYIYRYDHSTLQSLSQHLRHMTIHKTIVYVTDPSARSQAETISEKVPNSKQSEVMDVQLLNALCDDNEELNKAILAVQKEKFCETISTIINASRYSGGFPRLVRKLYKSFSRDLKFNELKETEKSISISTTLISRGYTCTPMPHGQCNAPINNLAHGGKCSNNGRLEKEKASAVFCQSCMFHSKDDNFLRNLQDEILVLEEDISSQSIPNCVRDEAIEARKSLLTVIEIHNHAAAINATAMRKVLEKDA